MKTTDLLSLAKRPALVALLAASAFSLCACSTTARDGRPAEKSASYKELHGMMVKLAYEPSQARDERQIESTASLADLGGRRTLATNP